MRNVTLILDDGSRFSGKSFGYEKPVAGEVVFNTAMTGYPESLTDPSYAGQLMTLTYPLVGNYGVPPFTIEPNGLATFMESEKIHAEAIIVSDYSYEYSHWNAVESLGDWLKREQIPGITGIDTRELTKVLREHGVMMGKIVFDDEPDNVPDAAYAGVNYVDRVSCKEIICYLPAGTSQTFSVNSSYAQLNSQFSTFIYKNAVFIMKHDWKPGTMIYPLPAVMVSCGNEPSEYNIITVAWVGTICTNPAMCYISVRPERISYPVLKKNMEFVNKLNNRAQ